MTEKILNREFSEWEPNDQQRRSGRLLCTSLGVSYYMPVVTDSGPGFLLGEGEDTALLFVRIEKDGLPRDPHASPRVWKALERLFLQAGQEAGPAEPEDA